MNNNDDYGVYADEGSSTLETSGQEEEEDFVSTAATAQLLAKAPNAEIYAEERIYL